VKLLIAFVSLFYVSTVLAEPPEFEEYAPRARMNFALFCAGCHQMSGKGSGHIVPDLGEYLGQFAQSPESRPFLVQVPGASSSPLDNRELAEVVNWILFTMNADQLKSDFKPYTTEEVAEYRKTPLLEVIPVRDNLVETIAHTY
jgi:hypothetical protein